MTKGVIFTLFVLVFSSSPVGAFDKTDLGDWLKHAESTLARTHNSTAIFHKQERIQEKLTDEETISSSIQEAFQGLHEMGKRAS